MPVTWFDGIEIEVLAGFSAASGDYGVWGTGEWDTATWGPDTVFTDISEFAAGIVTDRQFSRELTDWNAGTATVLLRNEDARFTPSNPDSPYVVGGITGIRPWRPIAININGTPIYTGYAISWKETYIQGSPGGGGVLVAVACVDELAALARFDGLPTAPQGGGEESGARIHRILDNAGHTGLRDIHVGRVTLQPTTHSQSAVTEMRLVTDSEGGSLYISRDGAVTFDDRYHIVEEPRSRNVQATFGDGGWQSVLNLSGGSASMPDSADLSTGDFTIRAWIAPDDWSPGGFGLFIVSQWPNVAGNNAWVLGFSAAGRLQLGWTPDGTSASQIVRTSTEAQTFVDGTFHWVEAGLTASTGDVRFRTSEDGVNWTQLGGIVPGSGATTVFNSTANVAIATVLPMPGKVRKVEYLNAAGDVVFNPDFTRQLAEQPDGTPTTTFKDDVGNTWTLAGNASIDDDLTVPAELPYRDASPSYDGDRLVNIVSLSRVQTEAENEADMEPPVTTVLDDTSRALYGDSRYSRTDLLNDADADLAGIAELHLASHKEPELRIDQITFTPRSLQFGTGTRDLLVLAALALRIRDKVRVIRRPPGGGTIVRDCHISGISHSINQKGEWLVTLKLWSATVYDTFTASFWDEAVWDDPAALWFF